MADPKSHSLVDEIYREPLDEAEVPSPLEASYADEWFRIEPLWKPLLLGAFGGFFYAVVWSYRNWQAYRRHWGYSRHEFWQQAERRSGYKPSPLWRALLSGYALCLFPAVHRECQAAGVRGLSMPIGLALAYHLFFGFGPLLTFGWHLPPVSLLGLVLVVVQAAINRLNAVDETPLVSRLTLGEIVALMLSAYFQWWGWLDGIGGLRS